MNSKENMLLRISQFQRNCCKLQTYQQKIVLMLNYPKKQQFYQQQQIYETLNYPQQTESRPLSRGVDETGGEGDMEVYHFCIVHVYDIQNYVYMSK